MATKIQQKKDKLGMVAWHTMWTEAYCVGCLCEYARRRSGLTYYSFDNDIQNSIEYLTKQTSKQM